MVVPSAGEIVLVPFPFSDLSITKVRPAVALAAAWRGDWILCQITSNSYSDPFAARLGATDFAKGGLQIISYARPGKLFTANNSLMLRSAGILNDPTLQRLIDSVVKILRPNTP
jgi:mRNA interferase MazF